MKPVGYAVVGLGGIAQQADLPAFANAKDARLVAVVSGDKRKPDGLRSNFTPPAITATASTPSA